MEVTFGTILAWTDIGLVEDTFELLPLSFVGLVATGITVSSTVSIIIDEPGRIKGSSLDILLCVFGF